LFYYWPFDSNLNDVISGANLFGGSNYSFTLDRFNSSNAALSLINGYLLLPQGIYFNGDYTLTVWIRIKII